MKDCEPSPQKSIQRKPNHSNQKTLKSQYSQRSKSVPRSLNKEEHGAIISNFENYEKDLEVLKKSGATDDVNTEDYLN